MVEKKRLKYEKPELLDLGGAESTLGADVCNLGSRATVACATNGASAAACGTGSNANPTGCGTGSNAKGACGTGTGVY